MSESNLISGFREANLARHSFPFPFFKAVQQCLNLGYFAIGVFAFQLSASGEVEQHGGVDSISFGTACHDTVPVLHMEHRQVLVNLPLSKGGVEGTFKEYVSANSTLPEHLGDHVTNSSDAGGHQGTQANISPSDSQEHAQREGDEAEKWKGLFYGSMAVMVLAGLVVFLSWRARREDDSMMRFVLALHAGPPLSMIRTEDEVEQLRQKRRESEAQAFKP